MFVNLLLYVVSYFMYSLIFIYLLDCIEIVCWIYWAIEFICSRLVCVLLQWSIDLDLSYVDVLYPSFICLVCSLCICLFILWVGLRSSIHWSTNLVLNVGFASFFGSNLWILWRPTYNKNVVRFLCSAKICAPLSLLFPSVFASHLGRLASGWGVDGPLCAS